MIKLIREEINFRYCELRHSAFSFYYSVMLLRLRNKMATQ